MIKQIPHKDITIITKAVEIAESYWVLYKEEKPWRGHWCRQRFDEDWTGKAWSIVKDAFSKYGDAGQWDDLGKIMGLAQLMTTDRAMLTEWKKLLLKSHSL